jgi:hypothetical protein
VDDVTAAGVTVTVSGAGVFVDIDVT